MSGDICRLFYRPALSANPPVEQFGIPGTHQVERLGRQILVIDEDQAPDYYVLKIITAVKNLHLNKVLSPLHDDDKDKRKETCQKTLSFGDSSTQLSDSCLLALANFSNC